MNTSALQMMHFVPGRVRLKLPRLKGDASLAQDVQRTLAALPGIQGVEVSALTGSVLVHYDLDVSKTWNSASLAPLLALAERLGLSLDTLPMEEVQHWLHLTSNGTKPLPPEALGSSLGALWSSMNTGAAQLNQHLGDVRGFIPLTLLFLGVRSFLVTEKLPFPSWYDYVWFAFGTYMALQPGRVTEQAP